MSTQVERHELQGFRLATKKLGDRKAISVALIISLFGIVGVLVATRAPDISSYLQPLLLALAVVLVGMAVHTWERGVQAILVVVVIEGAIRKWFMPSATELVYFYKDVLMIATLIGYCRKRRKAPFVITRHLFLVSAITGVFVIYALLAFALPCGPPVLVGLLGLKAYCLYIPLAFITPRAFPDKESLIKFLKWYLIIVLPVAAIGVMQFLDSNTQSTLNRYA